MNSIALINAASGTAGEQALTRSADALRKAGVVAQVEAVPPAKMVERARAAVDGGVDMVIAVGGDGTVSAIAGALAGRQAALAILPLGTLNHFARDLGIPFDLDSAAAIVAAGDVRTVDVATLDGRVFVNNSAVGLYPLMVSDREVQQQRLGRSKRLATLVAGVRTLARLHHHRLSLTVNDERACMIETPLLFVGNNDYRLDAAAAGQRRSIADGTLCVIALRRTGRLGLFAALVRALAGRTRESDMIKLDGVRRLRVDSRRSLLRVTLDGEVVHRAPPLDYAIVPRALRVIAPL